MDNSINFEFAIQAGLLMHENGAETSRVEDTMTRILKSSNVISADVFVVTTAIFASATYENTQPFTIVKNSKIKEINLQRLVLINSVSRNFVEGKIPATEALQQLHEIRDLKPYRLRIRLFASGVACFAFSAMLGSTYLDAFNSFFTGLFVFLIEYTMTTHLKIQNIFTNLICGIFIAICSTAIINFGIGQNLDKIIIGALIPLLPGVSFTSSVRDIFQGDLMSGITRMVDAIIVAVSLASGIGIFLSLWLSLGGFI